MIKKFSYKYKFFAVIGGFIILLFAFYKKNYKPMFIAKKELIKMKENLQDNQDLFGQTYRLENEIKIIDNIIGGNTNNPKKVQQMILDFVLKNKLKTNIVSIEDVHMFSDNSFLIYSNQIEFEGEYNELINLLYQIEKNFKSSLIINTKIYSKKNHRRNVKNLYLKIILQNYEKIK